MCFPLPPPLVFLHASVACTSRGSLQLLHTDPLLLWHPSPSLFTQCGLLWPLLQPFTIEWDAWPHSPLHPSAMDPSTSKVPSPLTFKEWVYFFHDIPTHWAREWEWCPCINKIMNILLFTFSSVMDLPGTNAYRQNRLCMTFPFCSSHTKNSGADSLQELWVCNKPSPPCLTLLLLPKWIVKGNSKPFLPSCNFHVSPQQEVQLKLPQYHSQKLCESPAC